MTVENNLGRLGRYLNLYAQLIHGIGQCSEESPVFDLCIVRKQQRAAYPWRDRRLENSRIFSGEFLDTHSRCALPFESCANLVSVFISECEIESPSRFEFN